MVIAAAAAKYASSVARGEEAAWALPRLGAVETLLIRWLKPATVPDDFAALSALTGLRELHLRDTYLPCPCYLTVLPRLEALTFRNITVGDVFSEDIIDELRCLTRLHLHCVTLDDCNRSETCATPLVKRATALRALSICPRSRWDFHARNLDTVDFASCLPRLMYLDLRKNKIDSTGVCGLAGLHSLAHLNLSHNDICDAGAAALTCLTALTKLCLLETNIGTRGVKALACLTDLVYLDVGNNDGIDDEGALALAGMTQVTTLRVSGCGIGKRGAAALRAVSGCKHHCYYDDEEFVTIIWGRISDGIDDASF
jgi:hypothetical protein